MAFTPWSRLIASVSLRKAPFVFVSWLVLGIAIPSHAADRIEFRYGLLGITVTRQELETFAATGERTRTLKKLLARLDPTAQAQFRTALQARYEVDPIQVNRFAYTNSGQAILEDVGVWVQTESGQNGFYGLRAALTLAAADPEGLSILNFLRHVPTNIRVDVAFGLNIAQELGDLLAQTQTAMGQLADDTVAIASTEPSPSFAVLPDPRLPGPWHATVQMMQLYDTERDRAIVLDLYIPEKAEVSSGVEVSSPLPVVVVSNGLGARRSRFDELALHLASHGFAVAMLDHPGSDRQRLLEFEQGLHSENFDATEYIDRPLDVSFVLDELTRLNQSQFGDRLNPDHAAVFGYSFGGTTALALAGARIDRAHLQQDCETRSNLFNISLLYQCRALELPPESLEGLGLRDDRVQAVYVYVPFSRSLYGPEGMAQVDRPVFWEATEQDILTPLVIEQLPAFSWLTQGTSAPVDHFLVVTEGLPHARLTLDVINRLSNQSVAWEEIKPIAETYHQMLATLFFQVYLADNDQYRPYLQATGMQYLTHEPYRLLWRKN